MLLCLLSFFMWETNEIWNVISFLSLIFVDSKPFVCNPLYFFHFFIFFHRDTSQLYLEDLVVLKMKNYDVWVCFSFPLVLHFIWTYYSAALHLTFATPRRIHVSVLLIIATTFHIILKRITCPKAHVMRLHDFHSLTGGLVMVTCDFEMLSEEDIKLCKVSWAGLPLSSIAQPNQLISLSVDKMKNLPFYLNSCNFVISQRIDGVFFLRKLISYTK